ncbi:glycosyltransferase family 4 protein [uncultured Pseudokineococcus sp.]|uniref:glycosyltransferase family 4 protein n=1 Tax=uncultured Pseudokineococcus sp. TaxID=1642928 RepID=UPI00263711C2|nr:glycosyltransferase family 4 protein [uncultured Pseudokineococcus sp.]
MSGRAVLVTHPGAELYGSDRVVLETVSALVERGWDVVVALPVDGPLVAAVESAGARVRRCPTPVLRRSALSPGGLVRLAGEAAAAVVPGARLLRETGARVVVVNTVTTPLWPLLARCLGRRVVSHVHEAESTASPLARWALTAPLLLAHRVVVNSAFARSVVGSVLPSLGARCELVYNGVPGPAHVSPPREDLSGPVRLLYVGRLSERKGVEDALAAVHLLARRGVEAELDVVGAVYPGNEGFEARLRQQVVREGTAARVRFHGFDRDVWPHLAAADVALVPSRVDEPFGNTAVEAVLSARPCVVSATSGLVEAVAGTASAHLVPPGSPSAIASAVEEIIGGWAQEGRAAQADAVAAARRFAPARYRSDVAGVVASVAGRRPRRPRRPRSGR